MEELVITTTQIIVEETLLLPSEETKQFTQFRLQITKNEKLPIDLMYQN
jgi:uncharacterized protein YjfI (DUF2170 family)